MVKVSKNISLISSFTYCLQTSHLYEIRVLWANIIHIKRHAMVLNFSLQKIWNRSLKWGTVHSCRSRGCKNIRGQSWRSIRNCRLSQILDWCTWGQADLTYFFLTSNFKVWYFCSLLTYRDVEYLIWKICFISVRRLKAKVKEWLLTYSLKYPYFISYRGLC